MRSVAALLSCSLILLGCPSETRPTDVAGPEAARGAPASGPIALTPDDKLIAVASADHNAVIVVDRSTREVRHRIALASAPTHLVMDEQGLAVVTSEQGHSVDVVDVPAGLLLRRIRVGVAPVGVTMLRAGVAAVALSGEASVVIVDLNAGKMLGKVRLPADDPQGVAALPDGRLLVTHRGSGVATVVDLVAQSTRTVELRRPAPELPSGMRPTLLGSITLLSDGAALLTHSQANPIGILAPPPPIVGCQYYNGCEGRSGAVVPSITEVTPDPPPSAVAVCGASCANGIIAARLLDPNQNLPVPLHNPVASVLLDGGEGVAVLGLGTNNVVMLRRDGTYEYRKMATVGAGAIGMTVMRNGHHLYTFNQFDQSVSEVPLNNWRGEWGNAINVTTFRIAENVLPFDVAEGRRLFHTALDARVAANSGASCAACHPSGQADGQTWKTLEGLRNTPALGGGILQTAPFHWRGDVATIEALNDSTVRPLMGGAGLETSAAVQMAKYLDRIPAAASEHALLPRIPAAVERGRIIFEDPRVGCIDCHSGPMFTDNRNHDVSTVDRDEGFAELQTPSLRGLARSAPYLHDGSARTLEQLVELLVMRNLMGNGSHLTPAERTDLVAYLKSL